MSNATVSLRSLRALTCASLATLLFAACGGGGGGGSNSPTDTASAGSGSSAGSTRPSDSVASSGPFGQDASDYKLTFSDEFNAGYNTQTWFDGQYHDNIWNDKMWYETSNPTKNYTVEDGKLKIWPQRDASGNFFNRTVDTDGKYYQKYGYFEIEAKFPKGDATWPAFWLFNHIGDRRPEMDIMEAYAGAPGWGEDNANGIPIPTVYAATVWEGENVNNNRQLGFKMFAAGKDLSESFNKYAVKWEPNKQTYYFNGEPILVINESMNDDMYIMLDLWFHKYGAAPSDAKTPQGKSNSYEINYVRAWQFK